ncbi:unnamed protein product, partial [Linum tenue]
MSYFKLEGKSCSRWQLADMAGARNEAIIRIQTDNGEGC